MRLRGGSGPALMMFAMLALASVARVTHAQGALQSTSALTYPTPPRDASSDELHDVRIADPFRPLEDEASGRVRAWIAAENGLTTATLRRAPDDSLDEQLGHLWAAGVGGAPHVAGDRIFYQLNVDAAKPPVVMTQLRTDLTARTLLDSASAHGTIREWAASPDGRWVAYTTDDHDGWRSVRIRDARSGTDANEVLRGVRRASIAWTYDGRGFFYVAYDTTADAKPLAPLGAATVRYHLVGRAQRDDYVVTGNAMRPAWRYDVRVTDDGEFATIAVHDGAERRNRLWFVDLDDPHHPRITAPMVRLFDEPDAEYRVVAAEGATFYVLTTRGAPRGQLVAVDINHPHEANWRGVVRESFDAMQSAVRVGDLFVVHYLHDLRSGLRLYALDGTPRGEVELPASGTIREITASNDTHELYFTWTGFLSPTSVYHYDLDQRANLLYREPHVDADRSHIEVRQVAYTGHDGMELPLWVMSRRGTALDAAHPLLLEIGGGELPAATPRYSPEAIAFVENGGVYVLAAVRGGGEYGQGWRDAGIGDRRSTALDDATAAAEWLTREGYTRANRLAITGTGADATIAAFVAIAHPELVRAAVLRDGAYDLMRYPRFTSGADRASELGSPDNPRQFRALLATSPLHLVQPATLPAFFIEAHEDDGSTPMLHSLKLAAALQDAQHGALPILLRIRGGASGDRAQLGELAAARERLRFLALALGD